MKLNRAGAGLAAAALTATLAVTTPGTATAAPTADRTSDATASASTSAAQQTVAEENQERYDRIVALLPADWEQRRDEARGRFGIDHSPVEDILAGKLDRAIAASPDGVIDPTDYECAPTALDAYVDTILADIDPITLLILSLTGALDMPTYEAILHGSPKDADFALLPAYQQRLSSTFGYAQRFWDVRLDDVQLMAMHGEMLTDRNRVARTVEYLYGVGPADATDIADEIVAIVESDPALEGGANPIFTLNAFAFTGEGDPDKAIRKLKDKMVFGDGILDALATAGLGRIGPEAVLGHEMAHHVQYEDDLFDTDLEGPEATRRTELMADGFGTYFVTHKKGLAAKPNLVLETQQAFYTVGDCAFDNPGHHGTPNQRRAASAWGAAEVAYAANPNKVLPSLKLARRFEKVLPELVKPDAPGSMSAYRALVAS
ncbi:hypothetical protein GCM10023340_10790 [Nocardioides marinquilinus]|uniref:Uncharacterized protein n=1 Tax=Nocardioides marinquilinus TaxID=1210400 RepID=A0ABP9PF76_9ACTN